MHKLDIPASVKAIGRAGAGTNNIPVKAMSARGVPVFNAPGANANANGPNMLGQISTVMAKAGLNIHNMINKSKGEVAYTLVDVDSQVPQQVVDLIAAIPGVLAVRYLPLEP
jgi:predicted regulator of amino acid metabolism with ACT domain